MKPVIYFPMYSLWILLYNGFKPKTSPRILTKYILGQCKTLQNEKKIGNEIDGLYKFKGIISRLNLSILCKITHFESILCVVRVWRFYRLYKLHRCEMERESERSKAKVWQWHLLKALSLKKKKKKKFLPLEAFFVFASVTWQVEKAWNPSGRKRTNRLT